MLIIAQVKKSRNYIVDNNIETTSENSQITRIVMPKIMQNLVVLVEPSNYAEETPLKAGNMILNRFCIDEDAAFELSGVHYLKKQPMGFGNTVPELIEKIKDKGKEHLFVLYYLKLKNLLFMNN